MVLAVAIVFGALSAWFGACVHEDLAAGEWVPEGVQARQAERVLAGEFGVAPPNLIVVVRALRPDGAVPVDAPAPTSEGERITHLLAGRPEVARFSSYWETRSPALRSPDGRSALVVARLRGSDAEAARAAADLLPRLVRKGSQAEVLVHGESAVRAEVVDQVRRDQLRGELLVVPLTVLLLLFVFRSVLAALLPVVVGAVAVAGVSALVRLVSSWSEVSVYAYYTAVTVGFGLTIDFCLLLLARYREELAAGAQPSDALRTTTRTAGRAVVYSAGTVSLSLAALLVFPHSLLRAVAWSGIAVVVLAAVGSLTIVPAALTVFGSRIDRFDAFARWRRPAGGPHAGLGFWGRCARGVLRHPAVIACAVTTVLVAAAAPFTHVRFGMFDDRILPASSPAGVAGAVLRADFDYAALANRTSLVLPSLDVRSRSTDLDAYARNVSAQRGVRRVDTATGSYARGLPVTVPPPAAKGKPQADARTGYLSRRGAWLAVVPEGEAYTPANRDVALALRALPAPAPVLVGGPGAVLADVQELLAARLPWALALVASTMFALVLAFTRRPLLAFKALVLNTLSMCAAFGVIVFVFQDGHLASWVGGFTLTGSTDVLVPTALFAVAFGLSMDYEIMLLSRMCEEYERTLNGSQAVVYGIDRTARLFTWAALTFAVVMAALAGSGLTMLKVVGVGLAVTVLVDAVLVRGLLVPAVMSLAGRANWWTPWPPSRPAPHPAPHPAPQPERAAAPTPM